MLLWKHEAVDLRAPDSGRLTCLKLCLYSLQAVSTVNLVLKMLQSFAP